MPTEQKLGRKTFRFYLYQNLLAGVVLMFIAAIVLLAQGTLIESLTMSALGLDHRTVIIIVYDINIALFVIACVALGIGMLISWVRYTSITFSTGEYALIIKRGIIDKREISIPYRQIQDVDVNRSLSQRMFGVSSLLILTAGEAQQAGSESEGALSVIDAPLAEALKAELLRRTNVQEVVEEKPPMQNFITPN
ncbi:PH domain-containing protein [Patescibacteria group bacterium]|nr:PH domain-containing protein [Patescibacteria group bacterium]